MHRPYIMYHVSCISAYSVDNRLCSWTCLRVFIGSRSILTFSNMYRLNTRAGVLPRSASSHFCTYCMLYLNYQEQKNSIRKPSFERQQSCSLACIWCLRWQWGWTWTWRRGQRRQGSARCRDRAWYQQQLVSFDYQQDGMSPMRSPVIEIEQMARPIQFHWLARDQACGEDEIQKRSGLFAFAFSSNGAQAFIGTLWRTWSCQRRLFLWSLLICLLSPVGRCWQWRRRWWGCRWC